MPFLQFCTDSLFLTASSDGSVLLHRIEMDDGGRGDVGITTEKTWKQLHRSSHGHNQSCNGLSCFGGQHVASAGEDGRVHLLNLGNQSAEPVRKYDKADSCSMTDVAFIKHDEILTSNVRGQLKLFDLRSQSDAPVHTSMLSGGDQVGVTCLSTHPTQTHIVATGSSDGSIAFWDLRQERHPVTILKGHEQAVSEVRNYSNPDGDSYLYSLMPNGIIVLL
jgi:WD40 repeat protein